MQSFRDFRLPGQLLVNLARQKILIPTEIQHKAFQSISSGKNSVLLSETGSGKTLAYLLPVVGRILNNKQTSQSVTSKSPETLIVLPNAALATQADRVLHWLSNDTELQHHLLLNKANQPMTMPQGCDVLLTTFPVLSQIQHLIPSLFRETRSVIVDEADLVLGPGSPVSESRPLQLLDSIKSLLYHDTSNDENDDSSESKVAMEKQFVFVCATFPSGKGSARTVISDQFRPVQLIHSQGSHRPVKSLQQQWISVDEQEKEEFQSKIRELFNLIRESDNNNNATTSRMLVFTNTTQSTQEAYRELCNQVNANANLSARIQLLHLHSQMPREDRKRALSIFNGEDSNSSSSSTKSLTVLIAGDGLARGFDFRRVGRVVQFDFSTNVVQYLHRIGRTARGGDSGEVVNLIGKGDEKFAGYIQQAIENDRLQWEGDDVGAENNVNTSASSASSVSSEKTLPVDKTEFARLFSRRRSLRNRMRNSVE